MVAANDTLKEILIDKQWQASVIIDNLSIIESRDALNWCTALARWRTHYGYGDA